MVFKSSLNRAIGEWQETLSHGAVIVDPSILKGYETATFSTTQSIYAVLQPTSKEDIQSCLKIANQYQIPIYPISKGKNWGYGSKVPVQDGCVLLSLERLNKIIDYDESLAYIRIQPGVTFQQVYDFLEEKQSTLLAPAIGSSPHASLIGNALERGIGKGTYGDRFAHSCNMEVILSTGELINTGFGHFSDAQCKDIFRWGIGPSLDGMFTQSNFGVVTEMTFWLTPKPGYFQTFFYTLREHASLPELIEALRMLRLEGTLTTTSTLSNDHRILSMKQQFPWQQMNGKTLPEQTIAEFRKKTLDGSVWVGDDAILAPTKAQGKARTKRVKKILNPLVDRLIFFDPLSSKIAKWLQKPIQWTTGVDIRELLYFHSSSTYLGCPLTKQLAMGYFRKKEAIPSVYDFDKDKCGFLWCSPAVPLTGDHVDRALQILDMSYAKHQFEPNIGLNIMSERVAAVTAAIIYDREVLGEDKRAMDCYQGMMHHLVEEGYYPYRLGIQSMQQTALSDSEPYNDLLQKIKSQIDPHHILSPSHYSIHGYNQKKKVEKKTRILAPVS